MSASSEAEEAAQFTLLTEFLAAALQDPGSNIRFASLWLAIQAQADYIVIVSLPDEVVVQFKSGTVQDDSSIREFNNLFGNSDHTNRLRLSHGAFINVVAILLHLPYSRYQERLLFAFIHTIELFKDPIAIQATLTRNGHLPDSAEEIQIKHRKINSKLIHKMTQVVVLDEQEPSMRLMAGHILYALLHGSLEAQQIARKHAELSNLGPLVDSDDDYTLRIFVANIIREMCATVSELHEFWPQIPKKKKNRHEDFPLATTPESAWLGKVADYLSSKDVGRGFHGDSRPLISKLLSIDTVTHAFKDDPGANILAVITEKFVFIIPGESNTTVRPLAMLEFELDSQCQCSVDERTSPDNRSEYGGDFNLKVNAAGRGYQVFEGIRSALDSAILVLPQHEQGETFAVHVSRSLQLLPPFSRDEDGSANNENSNHAGSRSFRRLDVGMIDMFMEGDSESDASSIVRTDASTSRRTLSISRSRQISRIVDAKLKEARHEKHSASAPSVSRASLGHSEPQELPTPSRSDGPRMPTIRKSDDAQADVKTKLGMNVDFENYVEQPKSQAGNESGRRAKPLQSSVGPLRDTIPTQHVESSPSNRAHRLNLKRPRGAAGRIIHIRPQRQSLQSEGSPVQGIGAEEMSEHRKPVQPRTAAADLEPSGVASKISATTDTDFVAQPRMPPTALRRIQKSQSGTANPMDWDGGAMADECNDLPAAKKPRLTKPTTKLASRQSQGSPQVPAETTRLEDSGAISMLKRPKAMNMKSQRPQQTHPQAKHDEFDIEDDGETAAPASTMGTGTTKRAAKAGKIVKSQVSKPTKGVSTKFATKGRKAMQPLDIIASLASNRPRRSQSKSKKYIDDSDSEAEKSNEEGEDILEKMIGDTMIRKQSAIAKQEPQKPAISAPLPRQTAEAPIRPIINERFDKAHSDHDVPGAQHVPIRRATQTAQVAAAHETLVTASPTRLDEADTRDLREESDSPPELREARKQDTQPQETSTGDDWDDSPDESAEDSYPKVTTKSQGPRDSFGSKLGQLIQTSALDRLKPNASTSHITPLSNEKSFVGSVNKIRSAASKKHHDSNIARTSKDGDAEPPQHAAASTKEKQNEVGGRSTPPIAQKKKQAAAQSNGNVKITKKASNGSSGPRTDAQQTQRTEASDFRKLPKNQTSTLYAVRSTLSRKGAAPATPSLPKPKVEFNESVSRQEDVGTLCEDGRSHGNQGTMQLRDTNTTIDLTQNSDEAMSGTGLDRVDDMQDDLEGIESTAAAKSHVTRKQNDDETSPIRQGGKVAEQSTRCTRAKLRAPEGSTHAKTMQQPELPSVAGPTRRSNLVASKCEGPVSGESTTKKLQLVHFDTRGPQNQGVSSPDKQTRQFATPLNNAPAAKKSMAYKQSRFAAARSSPFVKVPTLQVDSADSAGEGDYEDSGVIVEDDAVIEDGGEAMQEGHKNPISKESVPALTRHLPSQGSQSSRVDQNGSPRLPPPRFNHSPHLEDSGMNVVAEVANEHKITEQEDLTAWTEESVSESEEPASQDSDQSFHLRNEAPLGRQSDRSIRSRRQATATTVSSPKAARQAEQRPASATMRVKSMPRESLGLSKMVQEQYPEAQKVVALALFKKPALETAVSKALNISTRIPILDHKAPAPTSNAHRKPLMEVSANHKNPTVPEESSPNYSAEFSSAASGRVTEPQSKTRVQPHPASESLWETPGSLKTTLRVAHADKMVKAEYTILENLNRGKSAHQATKDADRTLVEGDSIHKYRGRQASDEAPVSSVSSPSEANLDAGFRQDDLHWRVGAREAQKNIRDALVEIADTVLIRLENEEKAIERRVSAYDTGCQNILNRFREGQTESFQRARQQVLERATARGAKVYATFNRLQVMKRDVHSRDTKDLVPRAVKEKGDLLAEQIKQMLKNKRDKVAVAEEPTE